MPAVLEDLLGTGLYTPAEAALFARVHPQTIIRWIWGSTQGKRVVAEPADATNERSVNFLQFVEALAIRNIRIQHRVPLQRIREASQTAADKYGLTYPFARRHRVGLLDRELIIELPDFHDPVLLTGRQRDQFIMKPIVQHYLRDLTFGDDGLAIGYVAWRSRDLEIRMNPKRQFGEPLLPSGHTAFTLWQAAINEGAIDTAARAYGIPEVEVSAAFEYFDHLEGRKAA